MQYKRYRQGMTVFDLSKKARPPPGKILLMNMNCLINWILLTIPLRPSVLYSRVFLSVYRITKDWPAQAAAPRPLRSETFEKI